MKDNPAKKNEIIKLLTNKHQEFPTKSLYILELPIFDFENGFPFMRDYYTQVDCADILSLKFNIEKIQDIKKAVTILNELLPFITKPLMIRGTNDDVIDVQLLPQLIKNTDRQCIISSASENTYKEIIPYTKENHYIVLRSPIDINLAKEINILSSEIGQPLDRIIIDTDIGGLGYGFEYGYSIIEKIKLEGKNDKYLNLPIISFACEEALKTKEAKSNDFTDSWGNLNERIIFFETASASAVRAAGADLIVINNPETLKAMKGIY